MKFGISICCLLSTNVWFKWYDSYQESSRTIFQEIARRSYLNENVQWREACCFFSFEDHPFQSVDQRRAGSTGQLIETRSVKVLRTENETFRPILPPTIRTSAVTAAGVNGLLWEVFWKANMRLPAARLIKLDIKFVSTMFTSCKWDVIEI